MAKFLLVDMGRRGMTPMGRGDREKRGDIKVPFWRSLAHEAIESAWKPEARATTQHGKATYSIPQIIS